MSGPEKGVDTDPDYAVVCGFLRRYGEALGLPPMSYAELQRALEDTTRLNPDLIMMQIKLMRKIGKSVSSDKWERYLVKMCRQFSQIAAWEMEQGGYQEVDPNIKLKLLKYLCERQFDDNLKFRAEVLNKEEADAMREKPLGRDKNGMLYWYMQDADMNLHLYREEPDDQYNSTWQVVCRTRDELEGLIAELEGGGKDTPEQEEDDDKSSSADQASLADEDKENKEEAQTDVKPKKENQQKEDIKTATDDKPRNESQTKENKADVEAPPDDKPSKEETTKPITSQPVSVIVKRELTPEPVKQEPTLPATKEDDSMKKQIVTVKSELEPGAGTSATSSKQSEAKDNGETSKGGDKQQEPPPKPVSHVHKGIHSIENILRDVPIKCERDAITEPPRVVSASMDPTVGLQTFANGRIHYCMGEGSSMDSVQMQGDMSSHDGQKERRSPTEGGSAAKEDDKGAKSKEMSETTAVEEAKNKVREILSKNTLNNSSSNTDESTGGRTANDREGQRSDGNSTGNKMPDSGKEMKTTEREQVSTNRVSDDKSESKKTEESRSTIEPKRSKVEEKEEEEEEKAESSEINTTSESEDTGKESKEAEAAEEDVTKYGEKSPQPGKESEKPDEKEEEGPGNKTVDSSTSKDKTGKESKEPDTTAQNTGEESKEPDTTAQNTGEESKESDTKTENAGEKSDHAEKETEDNQKEETAEKDNLETSEETTKTQRGRKRGRRGRKSLKEATKKPAKEPREEREEDLEGKEEEELDDSRSVSKDSESSKDAVSAPIRRSTRARKAVQQVYTPEVKKKPVTYPKEPSEPSLPPSPKPVKKTREKRGHGKRRGRRRKDSTSEEESEEEEEEESSEEEESEYPTEDDSPCCKCGMYNHPEWILLCDKCDSGYHTACLRPPLMMIPDGDWFCPSCEHVQLVSKLREALAEVDQELKKKQRAERRKERLTYVGISLENVIPEPDPKPEFVASDEEERIRPRHQHKKKKKQHHRRRHHHYYDDEKPVKTIAERRTSRRTRKDISYRFDDFDEVINEAIQEDIKASEGAGGYGGKDIENIIAAESGVVKKEGPKKGRRRRLMDLDADSEEEVGSEEEYNMSEGSEQSEVEEEPSEPSEVSLSDSEDSLAQRTRRRFQARRSSKATRRSSRLRSGRKRRYWDSDEEEEDIDDEHSSVSSDNIPRWSGVRTYSARRQKVCYKESSSSEEEKEKTKRADLPDLEWEPESVKEEGSPRRKRPRLESSSESESSSDETREEPKKPARRQLDTSESDDDEEEEEEKEKEETKDEEETKDQDEDEDSNKEELSEKDNKEQDTSTEGNKMGVSFQLPKVSKSMENSPTTDTLPLPAQMTQNGTHDSSGRSSRQSGEDEDELLANVMDLVAYVTEDD